MTSQTVATLTAPDALEIRTVWGDDCADSVEVYAMPGPFYSVDDVERANRRAGQHFFDRDTMRFFQSRVSDILYGGRVFVTSEKGPDDYRGYTVRVARDDGSIDDASEFRGFGTSQAAHKFAARIASAA